MCQYNDMCPVGPHIVVAYMVVNLPCSSLQASSASTYRPPRAAEPARPQRQEVAQESALGDNPTSPIYTPHQDYATDRSELAPPETSDFELSELSR